MVFRPGDRLLPPARGRVGYEFKADGSCTYLGISARDGSAREPCTFKLTDAPERELSIDLTSGQKQRFRVIALEPDRLVLSRI
jgi:hypothetical protein